MKIISKIKKVLLAMGVAIMLSSKKIFALTPLYGPPELTQNRNVNQNTMDLSLIWRIARIFIIPLILIIGLVYFKKSKSTTKRKIITMIIVALVILFVFLVIYYFMI